MYAIFNLVEPKGTAFEWTENQIHVWVNQLQLLAYRSMTGHHVIMGTLDPDGILLARRKLWCLEDFCLLKPLVKIHNPRKSTDFDSDRNQTSSETTTTTTTNRQRVEAS